MRLAICATVLVISSAALGGCSDDEPATRPTGTTTSPVEVTEETASVPKGSGSGDVAGSVGTVHPDDDWQVSCSDLGGGAVLVNAVGTAPNTIQATVDDAKVTKLVISYDELLSTGDPSAVTVKQVSDGYQLTGALDFSSETMDVGLELTCGA